MIRFYIIGGQGKKGQYGTNHYTYTEGYEDEPGSTNVRV